MQKQIEFSSLQGSTQFKIGSKTLRFIEDDKLNLGNIPNEGSFGFADNPGDAGIWPGFLQNAQGWQYMTDIANSGESQQADTFRWGLES